jgi:hypothetical protein
MSDIENMYGTEDDEFVNVSTDKDKPYEPDTGVSDRIRISNLEKSLTEATKKISNARTVINRLIKEQTRTRSEFDKIWNALDKKIGRDA